ncbi:hypothetical protein [Peribacillus frigoritolerans]|uniref:hypothetical protein n=1 Tax=Peribacillus frigoritolerans TaxID=450367 RepID=UPI0007BFA55D|nr:hypothetical protein [Peribacillus frigoritolerans]
MKNKILITILIISIGFNLFLFGKWFILEQAYEPSESEQVILSEMVQARPILDIKTKIPEFHLKNREKSK